MTLFGSCISRLSQSSQLQKTRAPWSELLFRVVPEKILTPVLVPTLPKQENLDRGIEATMTAWNSSLRLPVNRRQRQRIHSHADIHEADRHLRYLRYSYLECLPPFYGVVLIVSHLITLFSIHTQLLLELCKEDDRVVGGCCSRFNGKCLLSWHSCPACLAIYFLSL